MLLIIFPRTIVAPVSLLRLDDFTVFMYAQYVPVLRDCLAVRPTLIEVYSECRF